MNPINQSHVITVIQNVGNDGKNHINVVIKIRTKVITVYTNPRDNSNKTRVKYITMVSYENKTIVTKKVDKIPKKQP